LSCKEARTKFVKSFGQLAKKPRRPR
jgi:hypothetical protein